MGQDKTLDRGVHHIAPAAAAEDAVVACAFGFQVFLLAGRNAAAQAVCGSGLAGAGDVVQLTFDRQQRGGGDVLGLHTFGHTGGGFNIPSAVDQLEVLEHRGDGFEVVVRALR